MKILFIAPIPPPITGHSLVSDLLYKDLKKDNQIELVNLSKGGVSVGIGFIRRILEIIAILKEINLKKKNADKIYFTISESFFGNHKDLFIYLICFSKLSKMYIHLHGGSIKRLLWDKNKFVYLVNKFFIKKLGGVIISGNSHIQIFETFVPKEKIHIIPNFALDYLFLNTSKIIEKFENTIPLNILYISGMKKQKGYEELLNAYLKLSSKEQQSVKIDFAGNFESDSLKKLFIERIEQFGNLKYHGSVNDIEKKNLFENAHVFCLPTIFFEGQPISILEAYAAGCIVLTTGQPGILDIFKPSLNGYEINTKSISDSIHINLVQILSNTSEINYKIANYNAGLAKSNYKLEIYTSSIRNLMSIATN
jgi:glycosyltransferase involved in cell wall biosynthesis